MPSEKTPVIDYLWDALQAEGQGRRVVYSDDVVKAIEHCKASHGLSLSTGNPANFMKDVVRPDHASDFWPTRLTTLRIGGRQRPGKRRIFEFVDFLPGQTEPFPNTWMPLGLEPIPLESVSVPLTAKRLGRKDESWLIQVAVHLKIIEYHLSVVSTTPVVELTHLQGGVKLGTSEIDSLYLAALAEPDQSLKTAIVICEAKQQGQRILEHQLIEQIVATNRSTRRVNLSVDYIIPVAIKAIPPQGGIYVVEFKKWTPEAAAVDEEQLGDLVLETQALYHLRPPVPGIGYRPVRAKKANK